MASSSSASSSVKPEEIAQDQLPAKAEEIKPEGTEEADKSGDWRDLQQILPNLGPTKIDEIRELYGVGVLNNNANGQFVYMYCSAYSQNKCKYVIHWRREDGMVQAKGEHSHKKFESVPSTSAPTVPVPLPQPPVKAPSQLKAFKAKPERKKVGRRKKDDGLDELRLIFARAIEEETALEQQRLAAGESSRAGCSSNVPSSSSSRPSWAPRIEPSPSPPAQIGESCEDNPFVWAKKEMEEE